MLTAGELTAMQATQVQTLTETVTRQRRTLASDSAGGFTATTATVNFAGRLAPATGRDMIQAGQERSVVGWKITLPAGTDILASDKLLIGSRSFELIAIFGAETRETARVCICLER